MSAIEHASQTQHNDQGSRLALAIERILRPFIKLIVGRVSCGFLIQQVKRIYIEEARIWIEKNDANGRVTKSKLAMLTGLDTRTISSIEEKVSTPAECTVADLCPEAEILAAWLASERFVDERGKPKALPILGKGGSFQALVSSVVGRNVTYQTALERLVESGNVNILDENYVSLVSEYYQPVKTSEQTIIDAGSLAISRLSDTIYRNLNSREGKEKLLQQDRWSRLIPVNKMDDLRKEIRLLMERQIEEVENVMESYEDREEKDLNKEHKLFGIGWFAFKN